MCDPEKIYLEYVLFYSWFSLSIKKNHGNRTKLHVDEMIANTFMWMK